MGMGCEYGQGYLFSRPLSPDAVDDFLVRPAREVDVRTPSAGQSVVRR